MDIYLQLKADADVPYIYHMLGVIYWSREDLDRALDYYQRSLDRYQYLSDTADSSKVQWSNIVLNKQDIQRHISNVLRDIGEVHRRAGRLIGAEEYLQDSLRIQTQIGASFEQLLTLLALGKLSREKKAFDQSIEQYREALALAQRLESPSFEAAALVRLAETSYLAGNYGASIDWAMKATDLASIHDLKSVLAKALLFHGLSKFMQGYILQSDSIELLRTALMHARNYSTNTLKGTSEDIQRFIRDQQNTETSILLKLQALIDAQQSQTYSQIG